MKRTSIIFFSAMLLASLVLIGCGSKPRFSEQDGDAGGAARTATLTVPPAFKSPPPKS